MEFIQDSDGNSLRIQTIYADNSLVGTILEYSSICFVESYKIGENPWG